MGYRNKLARSGLVILAMAAALTACTGSGDFSISNESSSDVTVSTGGDEVAVAAGGAASILGSGCTPGDVSVEFASGETVVVAGPICPEEELVVRDGGVELRTVP
ncbi:hypothetical protein [Rhodoglobus aureus]|uniref:Lipoprotein n=1 Tax=Rhodoglobus aureus TaxID=191497 RepID=A0ABP4G3G9_9MICO